MGRPSTPAPGEGGGGEGGEEGKSGSALWMILIGLFSVVFGIIAVASPYWGTYSPPGQYSNSYDGRGHFGPFKTCQYTARGYAGLCGINTGFQVEVYLVIAGVCAIVGVITTAAFTMFSGLYCAMKLNNKKLCLKYQQSTFLALVSIILAEIATILAVGIGAAQFSLGAQRYTIEIGYCYIFEIVLIIVNFILVVLTFNAHKKAKKSEFPRRAPLYEISSTQFGPGHPGGGHVNGAGGITVTQVSGNPYIGQQQGGYTPAQLTAANLPQYPAPGHGGGQGDLYLNGAGGRQVPNGYNNGGGVAGYINGQNQQYPMGVAAAGSGGMPVSGQIAQPQVQSRPNVSMSPGVNLNPGGRGVSYHPLAGPGHGSMDSLNSTQSSVMSFGSTGSFSSNTSITNPIRSSLKKPKNKENNSIASGASKKSVTIAIGQEQTAV